MPLVMFCFQLIVMTLSRTFDENLPKECKPFKGWHVATASVMFVAHRVHPY